MKKGFMALLILAALLVCGVSTGYTKTYQVSGGLTGFVFTNNTLRVNYTNMYFEFSISSNGIVHLYGQSAKDQLPHPSYAVTSPVKPAKVFLKNDAASFTLESGKTAVKIDKKDLRFTVTYAGKQVFSSRVVYLKIGKTDSFNFDFDYNNEKFFGAGGQSTMLNLNGSTIMNYNADRYPYYSSFPTYIAMHPEYSCGVFLDMPSVGAFSFNDTNKGKNHILKDFKDASFATCFGANGNYTELYIMPGSPAEVLDKLTSITGRPYLPPLWAFGFHQCRYSYMSETSINSVVKNFEANDIPIESIWLDIDYMEEYKTFTVNSGTFPDIKKMTAGLMEKGIKTVTIIDPGVKVEDGYWVCESGKDFDVFMYDKTGEDYFIGKVWPGMCYFPDFTYPLTRAWWGNLYKIMKDWGVSGQWIDMNEPSVFQSEVSGWGMDAGAMMDWEGNVADYDALHNIYGLTMAMATSAGIYSADPSNRVFLLTRSAYPGIQRYAFMWTGDNVSRWPDILHVVPMILNLGLSGMPYSGSDIGGFSASTTAELFTRWMQLGAFMPFMRNHSAKGSMMQEPYVKAFKNYHPIIWKYIRLRYQLLPYLYTQVYHATLTGTPIMRPLFFDYGYDYCDADEVFLFGKNMLVCPVLSSNTASVQVALPGGEWIDFWSGKRYAAGKYTLPVTMENIPVFVRAGAILPTYEFKMKNTADLAKLRDVTLTVYPDSSGYAFGAVYEDDGSSWSFMHGGYRLTAVTCNIDGDKAAVTIKTDGGYDPGRKLIFVFPAQVKSAVVNGALLSVTGGKLEY
ncbi:MAG: hypothetical protein A2Y33_05785 [Spirochaetes bacterium GWF1_51_8]|nr:MAG: hypothetical protein A2Y33_05785 [Spirochaetes bacterium GWF1_51_8]